MSLAQSEPIVFYRVWWNDPLPCASRAPRWGRDMLAEAQLPEEDMEQDDDLEEDEEHMLGDESDQEEEHEQDRPVFLFLKMWFRFSNCKECKFKISMLQQQ